MMSERLENQLVKRARYIETCLCVVTILQENEVQEIAEKSASTVEDGSNNRKESTAIGKKKQFNIHH